MEANFVPGTSLKIIDGSIRCSTGCTRKCMFLKGEGNRMPVSSNLIFWLKNSIYIHTMFLDLDDQRVQNLRNYLVEVLLNSFSTAFFFS